MIDPEVETTSGRVRGSTEEGVHAFKGIRYAGSTGSENRFMPPTPPQPWTGVREANAYGPSCPQVDGSLDSSYFVKVLGVKAREPETYVDEDCLCLNVWTHGLGDGAKRPVMVWLHGGAFTGGSGSRPASDGAALARRGDVVTVTVNHRLGILGYLNLGAIAGEAYESSGNVGMLDLVAALEWVRDNIEGFGGDPSNVMIYGVSGGGYKVAALLAMPAAAGLFHRAVIQSAGGVNLERPERAEARAEAVLAELGLGADGVSALHGLPVERLIATQVELSRKAGGPFIGLGFSPHIDGRILPAQPGDAIATGASAGVPLVIGTTRHEFTRMFSNFDPIADDEALAVGLAPFLGAQADAIVSAYRKSDPEASTLDLRTYIVSDQLTRLPSIKMAERKMAGATAPVFMYLLTWESPLLGGIFKSAHSLCTPLVSNNPSWDPLTADYPESRIVAAWMSRSWVTFARDGNPGLPDLPKWPAYSLDERATMVVDVECRVENDPYAEQRLAWNGVKTGDEILV